MKNTLLNEDKPKYLPIISELEKLTNEGQKQIKEMELENPKLKPCYLRLCSLPSDCSFPYFTMGTLLLFALSVHFTGYAVSKKWELQKELKKNYTSKV